MKQDIETRELIDLGEASLATLGAKGFSTDFVREIPVLGINED